MAFFKVSLLTSAHMKSEVKTNFPNSEDQKFFALGLAGRPFEGSWGVRPRRFLWASARRQPSPRIHSTVRFGERSQAHMGDSGASAHLFFEASFSCLFVLGLPGPRSLGSCRARGPASYGEFRCHVSKPNVWVSPGLPDPLPLTMVHTV